MSIRNIAPAGKLLSLAVALAIAGATQAAAEPTPMQRFFEMMGLIDIPKDPIDYRERAPLVVPPSQALIPPRTPDDIRAINPDWPVDHDKGRRAAEKKSEDDQYTDKRFYDGLRLSPDEMRRGTVKRTGRGPDESRPENLDTNRLTPSQLGFKGWNQKKEERVVFTGEPERRNLTDPPVGLRTPSRDAPYGVVTERATPTKRDAFDRGLHENR